MNNYFKPVLAALFAALIAAGAYLVIPFVPMPLVLSNFFVVLAGLVLGPVWGGAAVAIYLLLGVAGLPVFAGGKGGVAILLGPTGGFLIGYLAAAVAGGFVARGLADFHRRKAEGGAPDPVRPGVVRLALAGIVALVVMYAVGLPWFAQVMQAKDSVKYPGLGWAALFMAPYLIGDAVKVAAAVVLARTVGRLVP